MNRTRRIRRGSITSWINSPAGRCPPDPTWRARRGPNRTLPTPPRSLPGRTPSTRIRPPPRRPRHPHPARRRRTPGLRCPRRHQRNPRWDCWTNCCPSASTPPAGRPRIPTRPWNRRRQTRSRAWSSPLRRLRPNLLHRRHRLHPSPLRRLRRHRRRPSLRHHLHRRRPSLSHHLRRRHLPPRCLRPAPRGRPSRSRPSLHRSHRSPHLLRCHLRSHLRRGARPEWPPVRGHALRTPCSPARRRVPVRHPLGHAAPEPPSPSRSRRRSLTTTTTRSTSTKSSRSRAAGGGQRWDGASPWRSPSCCRW